MARRRNIPKGKPKPKPAPVPTDPRKTREYHHYNPMREVVIEDGGDALLAHELRNGDFAEYLILNGMSEDGYWLSVEAGEKQAADIEANGIPLRTEQLTNDQKGWAKAEFYDHFRKEDTARWRPVPGKDSKVKPFQAAHKVHDREYRTACDCELHGHDIGVEEPLIIGPQYHLWGYRWDMRELLQCHNCGEVIARSHYTNASNNGDSNEHNDE